jgi:hypothetical protein
MKYSTSKFFSFRTFLLIILLINLITCLKSPNRHQSSHESKDPFSALGIPDLNPKALLMDIESENKKEDKKPYTQLRTIEDLPKFLANNNLNEDDGIKILTKFLIQVNI